MSYLYLLINHHTYQYDTYLIKFTIDTIKYERGVRIIYVKKCEFIYTTPNIVDNMFLKANTQDDLDKCIITGEEFIITVRKCNVNTEYSYDSDLAIQGYLITENNTCIDKKFSGHYMYDKYFFPHISRDDINTIIENEKSRINEEIKKLEKYGEMLLKDRVFINSSIKNNKNNILKYRKMLIGFGD